VPHRVSQPRRDSASPTWALDRVVSLESRALVTIDELRQHWALRRDEWTRLGIRVDGGKLAEEILLALDQLGGLCVLRA
jgi:hypothetical protein